MKPYRILKTFNGSQTGLDFHTFTAGTVAELSDDLAEQAIKQGWCKPHQEPKAEDRVTKVVAPEETKVVEPEAVKSEPKKKGKK